MVCRVSLRPRVSAGGPLKEVARGQAGGLFPAGAQRRSGSMVCRVSLRPRVSAGGPLKEVARGEAGDYFPQGRRVPALEQTSAGKPVAQPLLVWCWKNQRNPTNPARATPSETVVVASGTWVPSSTKE